MKQGDVIAGYRLVSEPTNANGGKCIWAFAEREGKQYFLKRFLEPKRPREGASGSAVSLRIRRQACEEFEERHRGIMRRLRPDARGGGNLVLAVDFFHERSTYYKVTERIDTASLAEPHTLAPAHRAVLLKTLGSSLKLLHDIEVVHGDLKPANVLVQRREGATFHTAKLIDFDDSYVSGQPPGRDDIAGDSLYGAPEWRRYVQGDELIEEPDLTTAVDIFALGLMTHLYLTGAVPGFDERFGSPADAVNAEEALALDARLSDPAYELVRDMTAWDPGARPSIETFLAVLGEADVCALGEPRERRAPRPAAPAPAPAPVPVPGGSAPAEPGAPAGDDEPGDGGADGDGEGDAEGAPRTSRVRANLTGGARAPGTGPGPVHDDGGTAPRPSRVRFNPRSRRSTS
ncbi:protein kinase domain-containing protein [Streptomyces sp. SBT349]|uniref:protein kinase domain-containing protein n=1 Tax=Streptomyces sp. SBT349 TaxID=1580539 RepID=UPI0007C7FDCE|nr:lipopolysaccharide kinase InaA family protein [Streptomyces sp. SBT349]